MGWLDTPEGRRRQHVQVIAGGNINDLDRIHERDRNRKINAIFWVLFVSCALLGFVTFNSIIFGNLSYYFIGLSILFLIILLVRYGLHKKIKRKEHKKNDWERIRQVPNWVYKKMKRKHSKRINGKHFVYKREGNEFYRKLR